MIVNRAPNRPVSRVHERQLLLAWVSGDVDGFLRVAWEGYAESVLRYLLRARVPPQLALEFRQDVFTALVRDVDRFDGRDFTPWLFSLARYQVLTWLRRARRQRRWAAATPAEEHAVAASAGAPSAESRPARSTSARRAAFLLDFIDRLPEADRRIVQAFVEEVDDATLAQSITAATGRAWNVNMVRQRRRRLRAQMQRDYLLFCSTPPSEPRTDR